MHPTAPAPPVQLGPARRRRDIPIDEVMQGEIAASWHRSACYGVSHEHAMPAREPATERGWWAELAAPVIDAVAGDLAAAPISVVLADERGRIVDRRDGDASVRRPLDRVGLEPGRRWSERDVGTNALGTAVASGSSLRVSGREHFADRLDALACAAAPVADPRTGRLVAVVGLACEVGQTSAIMLPFVRRVGREIEDQLTDWRPAADRRLLGHFVRERRHARGPVVAVSERTMFANAAASRLLEEADRAVLWDWAERTISHGGARRGELELTDGTTVAVRCAPVVAGSTAHGALLRLEVREGAVGAAGGVAGARGLHGWQSLTGAQLGIADLVAAGATNQEVAARVHLSRHTVDFHLRQIFAKLGISSRAQLARIVGEHGGDHGRGQRAA